MTLAKDGWFRAFASSPFCRMAITIQCNCPNNTASCFLDTTIWLGEDKLFETQIERSDPEAVCWSSSFSSSMTCWLVVSDFLGWPLIQPGGQVQADMAQLRVNAYRNIPGDALLGPPHQRWRSDALQPPEILQPRQERDTCAHLPEGGLRCVSWNTRGLLGSASSFSGFQGTEAPLLQTTCRKERHHLPTGNAQFFFFTSPAGTSRRISNVWQFHPG